MDTSKQYIKMCDCSEIQSQVILADTANNTYWDIPKQKLIWGNLWEPGKDYSPYCDLLVWLPRQDQLQDMVDNLQTTPISFMKAIVEWSEDPYGFGSMPFPKQLRQLEELKEYLSQFETHEQILTVFIMHELHQKTWNGTKWEQVK